jgi:hypothetical protein
VRRTWSALDRLSDARETVTTYTATVRWTRDPSTDFAKGQYSRAQEAAFDDYT